MRKIYPFVFLLLVFSLSALADIKSIQPTAKELFQEEKKLTDEWGGVKKQYQNKISDLIGKMEDGIHQREKALDGGDAKLRHDLNEETADLKRERDHLKRLLAQISAADVVGWSKVKEEIHDKIQNLKGSTAD